MKKKEFKNAAKGLNLQDALLESTGQTVPQKREKKELANPQTTTQDTNWERFTVVCSSELVEKIKAIAQKEGFTIREVVEKFFSNGIGAYENKHGRIKVATKKKRNIDDVL